MCNGIERLVLPEPRVVVDHTLKQCRDVGRTRADELGYWVVLPVACPKEYAFGTEPAVDQLVVRLEELVLQVIQ